MTELIQIIMRCRMNQLPMASNPFTTLQTFILNYSCYRVAYTFIKKGIKFN